MRQADKPRVPPYPGGNIDSHPTRIRSSGFVAAHDRRRDPLACLMLAYSPVADRLATRLSRMPPKLRAFRAIQRSWMSLALGVVVAWVLGGFIEESLLRGVVLPACL